MALQWGADDLDGTIGEEKIAHAALASSPLGLTAHKMLKLIREAGRVPVQRNAKYWALTVFPAPPAPTHWSQRGARDVAAEVPLKVDPAVADSSAVSLQGEELYSWDLVAMSPEELAARGVAADTDDLAGFEGVPGLSAATADGEAHA